MTLQQRRVLAGQLFVSRPNSRFIIELVLRLHRRRWSSQQRRIGADSQCPFISSRRKLCFPLPLINLAQVFCDDTFFTQQPCSTDKQLRASVVALLKVNPTQGVPNQRIHISLAEPGILRRALTVSYSVQFLYRLLAILLCRTEIGLSLSQRVRYVVEGHRVVRVMVDGLFQVFYSLFRLSRLQVHIAQLELQVRIVRSVLDRGL